MIIKIVARTQEGVMTLTAKLSDAEMFTADRLLGERDVGLQQLIDSLSMWDRDRFLDGLTSLQRRGLLTLDGDGRGMSANLRLKAVAA